jgi:hypothetical protein
LVTDSEGGKVKEEKGFEEEEERDGADIEALRECERVWECLGPLKEWPLPILNPSNLFLAARS